jgi:hypothetical protein
VKRKTVCIVLLSLAGCLLTATQAVAQGLQLTFGSNGLQTLAYNGIGLEDTTAYPGDAFHIWHMQATDLSGNVLTTGQYGWGENNNGRTWNQSSLTWTYNFTWGTITTQYQQVGNTLNLIVTETNNSNSGIILSGASIYPLALNFPQLPAGFSGGGNYLADNTSAPSVTAADYGTGEVVAVVPNASRSIYSGFQANGNNNAFTALVSTTNPDSLASFETPYSSPVQPGQTATFTVSLRFAPSGTASSTLATDAYQSWMAVYPAQLNWPDRRIIGTVYLASSPSGPLNQPGGYPNNPRRYFNDSNSSDFDVTTPAGLALFQAKVLQQAQNNVQNLQGLGAQGAITWDIEGEQYPQDTSYVCSPDQIGTIAPEMESIITNPTSPYVGMHLVDAYFQTMKSAGFRIGVCIRPQQFTLYSDGTAAQVFVPNSQVAALLISKMQYAHNRWGTTLFYVDSTVNSLGGTLPPSIFEQVQAALPDSLIIPEESTPRHFAYTAPFLSFIFHTDLGTAANTYNFYPHAFSANLVNDVSATTLAQYEPQLIQSVRNGDILMAHADYWQANNPTIVAIYQAAGVTAPTPTSPTITWPSPAAISFGTALSAAQLDASANTSGTFTYTPASGAILPAGMQTLSVTFTPSDATSYRSVTASVTLQVNAALPVITWPVPASIPYGTALSGTQLNATSNTAGTFTYSPASGSVLPAGIQLLTVTFTPADQTDYTTSSTSVPVSVLAQSPTITFSVPVHNLHDATFCVAASSNSSGPFTYTVVSGPATVAGCMVTLLGRGVVVLQATQAANGNFAAASQTAQFLVLGGSLWLGKADGSLNGMTTTMTSPSSSIPSRPRSAWHSTAPAVFGLRTPVRTALDASP